MDAIIHVDRTILESDRENDAESPALTVETNQGIVQAHTVDILGPSRLKYRPKEPQGCQSCYVVAWIEADTKDVMADGLPLDYHFKARQIMEQNG